MDNRLSRIGGGAGDRPAAADAPDTTAPEGTDVLGLLEDIESQFQQLRAIGDDQVHALRDVAERAARLDEQEATLATARQKLEEDTQEWVAAREREQQSLDDAKACLEADRESQARRLSEDKDTVARDRQSLDDDRERSRRESDTVRAALATTRSELEERERDLDERTAGHENACREWDAEKARVEAETEASREEHLRLIDALHAARQLVDKRGRRTRSLARREETLRRDRRLLRRRRHALECANRAHRRRITMLEDEAATRQSRLDEAGRRMRQFMEHLREQADLIQRGHAAMALVNDLRRQVEQLEAQAQERPEPESVPADTLARIEELEREVESARSELAAVEPQLQELETLREARQHTPSDSEVMIEDRTRRLGEVAQHLHRRRTRLKRVRDALGRSRDHTAAEQPEAMQQRLRQSEIIEQRQQELDNVQRMLASSEKKMIKRWAAPAALVLTSRALLVLTVIGAASWFAAENVTPPVRTASVVLSPVLASGEAMDEETAAAWTAFHEAQLGSERFIRDVAKRSAARHLSPWDTRASVDRVMRNGITIDSADPGRLVLTLPSDDPNRAAAFLDVLATSMTAGAKRTIASRPGGHVSKVLDDRTDDGVLRFARIDWTPQRDDRLVTAGVFFGGGVLLVGLIMSLVYGRLLRAKRIFEQSHALDFDVPITPARPI